MGVTLDRADEWSYDILVDGEMVGYIEGRVDSLTQIEIHEEYRGHGYGKTAVRQFVDRAEQEGADYVETSAVVSGAMESIVRSLGFEQCEDDPSHFRLYL